MIYNQFNQCLFQEIFSLKRVLTLCLFITVIAEFNAQDIEPRRWNPLPLKTNVAGVGYLFTGGTLLFDPSTQIRDARVKAHTTAFSFVKPIKLKNTLARIDVLVPFTSGDWNGLLSNEPASVNRFGLNDPRIRFSVTLSGAPPADAKQMQQFFKKHPKHTIWGASISITLPLGEYYSDKLINLGRNRFAIRPQLGLLHRWNNWSFEFTGSIFLFTNNTNFYNNQTKKQKPLAAIQSHIIKSFKNRAWTSFSLGYGNGGQSKVDSIWQNDSKSELLLALSCGKTIFKNQSIKLFYLRNEALNSVGADTNSGGITWGILF